MDRILHGMQCFVYVHKSSTSKDKVHYVDHVEHADGLWNHTELHSQMQMRVIVM